MDRRRFLLTSLAGALAAPLAVEAQQAGKLPTIGLLGSGTAAAQRQWTAAFVQRLRELGAMPGVSMCWKPPRHGPLTARTGGCTLRPETCPSCLAWLTRPCTMKTAAYVGLNTERHALADPLDVYVDTYQVSTNPWAGTINFSLTSAMPAAPGVPPQAEHLVSVRLSLENLKLLAFFLSRQIAQHERNFGVNIQVPQQVLNQLQIGAEDWQTFWKRGDARGDMR